jgi:hypothetical protein
MDYSADGFSPPPTNRGHIMVSNLISSLTGAGLEPLSLNGKLVVMSFGGRIIALLPDSATNVFWVNPQLESVDGARAFQKTEGWLNSGGDRTWIYPEIETNGDPARWEGYFVPHAMDPAQYSIIESNRDSVTLRSRIDLPFRKSQLKIPLRVTRKIEALSAPPFDFPADLDYAGFSLDTRIDAEAEIPEGVRPGAWSILQVAGGGELIVPMKTSMPPRDFFKTSVYQTEGNVLKCRYKTDNSFKFCIRAGNCTGKMFYLNRIGGRSTLIFRTFDVFDEGRYGDYPSEDHSDTGYVQMFYVDDGGLGDWGELEHQSPYLADGRVTDRCETHAFIGDDKHVTSILETFMNNISD